MQNVCKIFYITTPTFTWPYPHFINKESHGSLKLTAYRCSGLLMTLFSITVAERYTWNYNVHQTFGGGVLLCIWRGMWRSSCTVWGHLICYSVPEDCGSHHVAVFPLSCSSEGVGRAPSSVVLVWEKAFSVISGNCPHRKTLFWCPFGLGRTTGQLFIQSVCLWYVCISMHTWQTLDWTVSWLTKGLSDPLCNWSRKIDSSRHIAMATKLF